MHERASGVTRGHLTAGLLCSLGIAAGVALVSCRSSAEPTPTVGTRVEQDAPRTTPPDQREKTGVKSNAVAATPSPAVAPVGAEASDREKTDECSDGMSDDPYPLELRGVGESTQLSGCCRIKSKDEH